MSLLVILNFSTVGSGAECPQLTKEGDAAALQFDGGASIVHLLRQADASTSVTIMNPVTQGKFEKRLVGPFTVSLFGEHTYEYDKDIMSMTKISETCLFGLRLR